MIGFGLISDWMKKWHGYFKPIGKRSYAKPTAFRHSSENRSMHYQNASFTDQNQKILSTTTIPLDIFKKQNTIIINILISVNKV